MEPSMKKSIRLGKKRIDEESYPYVIAEIGVNHEGSFEKAKELISLAKEGGADAAKFQTYKAETLASRNSPSYWDLSKESTTSQYHLFKKYDAFGPTEYEALARYCEECDIDFLSTPFDMAAVDFLDPLVPFFKIASADLTNIPFLRKIGSKGKPVVLSTGASTLSEIRIALETLKKANCSEIALLHCILNYPTRDENAHLNMIVGLKENFPDYICGYSDHTHPDPAMTVLTTSYLKGARILEKHFTHDKTLPGNDHYHAMDVGDLRNFHGQLKKIRMIEGKKEKTVFPSEEISRLNARRSVVLKQDIARGTVITNAMLIPKRPGTGITPLHWDEVIGMTAVRDLKEDHVLRWSDILPAGEKKDKVVAVVQARMESSRFPGKMMTTLAGSPLIDWVLGRVKCARSIHEVVLAIPEGEENDILEKAAQRHGCAVFRGNENDVLDRFFKAAQCAGANHVVRICADNPFIDPIEIDKLVGFYLRERPDYAFNHLNRMDNRYPDGLGAEIVSFKVLEDISEKAVKSEHREHSFLFIWDHLDLYDVKTLKAEGALAQPNAKLDIDSPKDLEKLSMLLERIAKARGHSPLPSTVLTEDLLKHYAYE